MVFFRDIGVGRHDLTPQNSTLFLRVKSGTRLDLTQKSSFLDGHYLFVQISLCLRMINATAGLNILFFSSSESPA